MERIQTGTEPKVRRKTIPGIVFLVVMLGAAAWAAVRLSASYEMTVDVLSSGGGASISASYQASENAIGETAGFSRSAGYQMQAGVVQPTLLSQSPSRVDDWKKLTR